MRHLILLIIIIACRVNLSAQCDTTLIGQWNPITIIWEETRFDLKGDSISISRENNLANTDSSKEEMKHLMTQILFKSFQYIFKKDGSFEITFMESLKDEGTYCFNKEKGIIITTTKNSLDQPVSDETKARLFEGLLYMKITVEEGTLFDLILKRKKTE